MERIGSDTRAYHSLTTSFVWDVARTPNVETFGRSLNYSKLLYLFRASLSGYPTVRWARLKLTVEPMPAWCEYLGDRSQPEKPDPRAQRSL